MMHGKSAYTVNRCPVNRQLTVFGYCTEIPTSDPKVTEGQDKADQVYFDKLSNFVG